MSTVRDEMHRPIRFPGGELELPKASRGELLDSAETWFRMCRSAAADGDPHGSLSWCLERLGAILGEAASG